MTFKSTLCGGTASGLLANGHRSRCGRRSSSPEVQQVCILRCCAVSIFPPDEESKLEAEEFEDSEHEEFEEPEPEEHEEHDDSALEATMDEEELLADERAAREVSEMLRWYSQLLYVCQWWPIRVLETKPWRHSSA